MSKKKGSRKNRYSKLAKHQRIGKKLQAPFNKIPNLSPSSWVNDCIPNILWACILAGFLDRKLYLNLFRTVIVNTREHVTNYKEVYITHNALTQLSNRDFDIIFQDVLNNNAAKRILSSLLLLDSLPDKHHWERHLEKPIAENINIIVNAVGVCFDHQSQESTDIRWLKVMYLICTERMYFPQSMAEMLEEFRCYPDKGDMKSVRPVIRSMEIGFRTLEAGKEGSLKLSTPHQEDFWKEGLKKSECIFAHRRIIPDPPNAKIRMAIFDILRDVSAHFDSNLVNTDINPRLDTTFGLVMYACTLALNASMSHSHTMVEGRMVLRSIVEIFILLHFLKHKDDPSIWMQYRNYGSGQTKLAFLKNLDSNQIPDFLNLERLEQLANEDMWLEFQDIPLGAWSGKNLRDMAAECNVKDVYDTYYDWSSGYSHAHWLCVRDTVFAMCMNPLHRFHRVPVPPSADMPSIMPDACKLINRMLDDLNALYPSFKPRLKKYTLKDVYEEGLKADSENEPK